MAPARGFGLSFGIGQQTVYGTPVAITNWLRGARSSMKRSIIREKVPHLGSYGQASTTHRYQYNSREESGGRIEWIPSYNDTTLMILRHVFGVAPTDAGSGPNGYTHAFTLASPPPAGFTLEQIGGTHATLDLAQVYTGCKANLFEMTLESGQVARCALDIIAQTATGFQAPSATPTYTTSPFTVKHNHLDTTTSVTIGGTQLASRRLVLTVNRNLSRNHELGSLLTSEPFENRLEVGLELEVLWGQSAPWTAHYADSQGDITWNLVDGTRSMAWTLHNGMVDEVDNPTEGADGIRQTVRFTGYADATDQGLGLTVTNSSALYTAN